MDLQRHRSSLEPPILDYAEYPVAAYPLVVDSISRYCSYSAMTALEVAGASLEVALELEAIQPIVKVQENLFVYID